MQRASNKNGARIKDGNNERFALIDSSTWSLQMIDYEWYEHTDKTDRE